MNKYACGEVGFVNGSGWPSLNANILLLLCEVPCKPLYSLLEDKKMHNS